MAVTISDFPLSERYFSAGKHLSEASGNDKSLVALLNFLAGSLGAGGEQVDLIFTAATRLEVASGAITVTQGSHTVDGESASADTLSTINGGTAEELILLRPDDPSGAPITINNAGNIITPLGEDLILSTSGDFALLAYDGTNWTVVAYSVQAVEGDPRLRVLYNSTLANPGLVNGSTAGNIKTGNAVDYRHDGQLYTKAATDDLWDLSGETDTGGSDYRAYSLELNASGTASFQSSGNQTSAALALANLPLGSSRIGVFIADPSCDFDDAGGLAAQGTYYNGSPTSV